MSRDRRTKAQKRKAKLAAKERHMRAKSSLAVFGGTFQTNELVPLWVEVETPLYEVFVYSKRQFDDVSAYAALSEFILETRRLQRVPDFVAGDLNVENDNWSLVLRALLADRLCRAMAENSAFTLGKVIGVMRSVLGSICNVSSRRPGDRQYMFHIEKFLVDELGLSIREVSQEEYERLVAEGAS